MADKPRPRGTVRLTHLASGKSFREWLADKIGDQHRGELAEKIGIGRTAFNNFSPVNPESESNIPNFENLMKILDYFGEHYNSFHRQGTPLGGEMSARKDEILKMYSQMGMSAEDIAPYFETSPRSIGRLLEECGEKLSKMERSDRGAIFRNGSVSKLSLEEMVFDRGLDLPEILELTNLPETTIRRKMNEYGIEFPTIRDHSEDICRDYQTTNMTVRELAAKYGSGKQTISNIIKENDIEISDDKRIERVRDAKTGTTLTENQKRRIAEARLNSTKGKVMVNGIPYDSKQEAAASEVLKRYLGYELVKGVTFQRYSPASGAVFDFVLPNLIVEWHPPREYDSKLLSEEEREAFEEIKEDCPDEQKAFVELANQELADAYKNKRLEAIRNDGSLEDYNLVVLKSFDELYDFVCYMNPKTPRKRFVRRDFEKVRTRAQPLDEYYINEEFRNVRSFLDFIKLRIKGRQSPPVYHSDERLISYGGKVYQISNDAEDATVKGMMSRGYILEDRLESGEEAA
jgi:hypothetical protein